MTFVLRARATQARRGMGKNTGDLKGGRAFRPSIVDEIDAPPP